LFQKSETLILLGIIRNQKPFGLFHHIAEMHRNFTEFHGKNEYNTEKVRTLLATERKINAGDSRKNKYIQTLGIRLEQRLFEVKSRTDTSDENKNPNTLYLCSPPL